VSSRRGSLDSSVDLPRCPGDDVVPSVGSATRGHSVGTNVARLGSGAPATSSPHDRLRTGLAALLCVLRSGLTIIFAPPPANIRYGH